MMMMMTHDDKNACDCDAEAKERSVCDLEDGGTHRTVAVTRVDLNGRPGRDTSYTHTQ